MSFLKPEDIDKLYNHPLEIFSPTVFFYLLAQTNSTIHFIFFMISFLFSGFNLKLVEWLIGKTKKNLFYMLKKDPDFGNVQAAEFLMQSVKLSRWKIFFIFISKVSLIIFWVISMLLLIDNLSLKVSWVFLIVGFILALFKLPFFVSDYVFLVLPRIKSMIKTHNKSSQ